jgi:hypothetical protein
MGGGDGGGRGDGGTVGPCDAKCGVNVPTGFTLVTSLDGRNTSCPDGWTSKDVVANPTAAVDACSCACNVTTQPSCAGGAITRHYDQTNGPMCNVGATTINASGSGCNLLPNAINALGYHYSATLAPTGGACTFDAKADASKVMAREARICEVPATCQGAVCGAKNICVTTTGDIACPATFPVKQMVGASANLECSACAACKVAATCGGTLAMYTDYNCSVGKATYPVDGTCNTNPAINSMFLTYIFQGSVGKVDCGGPAPTSTGTPKLAQPTTVCCQK